jgi:hypothetical protein
MFVDIHDRELMTEYGHILLTTCTFHGAVKPRLHVLIFYSCILFYIVLCLVLAKCLFEQYS